MALRNAPTDVPATPHTAQGALAHEDTAEFLAAARRTAEIGDPHERYAARRMLLATAFAGSYAGAVLARRLIAAAGAGVTFLEDEPREPVLLNLTGVALYELGALAAAQAVFEAAERLAPGTTEAPANLRALQRQRRRGTTTRLPQDVAAALPALDHRARRCAAAAQPVQGLTLSLCMIVRDEEEHLPRCLEAARPAVDEIVVVDTGSTDATREIAASYGARVIDFPWTGSFADARNVAFDAATADWMMFLDADEVLVGEDLPRLRALLGRTWREAFYLVETSYVGALEDGSAVTHNALRVFRNRPGYRFEGRIHEQILPTLPTHLGERFETCDVRVEHFGYLGVVRDAKGKSRRNIELLERQATEGESSAFHAFNLGSEYLAIGEAAAAAEHLGRAWELVDDSSGDVVQGFAPVLTSRLVKALRADERPDEAAAVAERGLEIFDGFTDLVFEQAGIARDRGELATAAGLYQRCLEMGDAPSRYTATVGCGTHLALSALAAVLRELGDPEAAEELLRRCLHDHPGHLGAVDPLAATMLARGASADDVAAEVEDAVGRGAPSVEFTLGTVFYEAGRVEQAEACFRTVLERQPHSALARVALAETELSQRRWADAAATAAAVPSGGVCSAAARHAEAFALLVAGEHGAARVLVDGPAGAELADAERGVLAAWAAITAGGRAPATLPREAIAPLLTTLEALLRVEEVDAFAALVGLLDVCGMPRRERHEALAGMYLRRGFVASAAEEWMTACATCGPDVSALIGLATVALAGGDAENAEVFAAEAAALDGADPRPAAIARRIAQASRGAADDARS